jgi:hypothetical protein
MIFYNSRRFHQSLGYKTPMDVWSVGETAMDMPALDRIAGDFLPLIGRNGSAAEHRARVSAVLVSIWTGSISAPFT